MDDNPWNVGSIHEFWSLKCPECVFDSKEEEVFQDHALRNHPLSFAIFGKTSTNVKEEFVDPFFETDGYHDNQDQISIKKELSSEFSSSNTAFPSVNGEKNFRKKQCLSYLSYRIHRIGEFIYIYIYIYKNLHIEPFSNNK